MSAIFPKVANNLLESWNRQSKKGPCCNAVAAIDYRAAEFAPALGELLEDNRSEKSGC
jgi:hypothetical protein